MDVLKFLDSVWTKGVPLYYWDGKELNQHIGLFHNENLAGWMLAARNIKGMKSEQVVDEAAAQVRKKMRRAS
jgi:hypothetical protein